MSADPHGKHLILRFEDDRLADPRGSFGKPRAPRRGGAQVIVAAANDSMRVAVATGRIPHNVYRRTGRRCPRCATPIRSFGQGDANRTTYWCPSCQQNPVGDQGQ